MKLQWIFITVFALFLASCSSSKYVADDVYYNPKDEVRAERKAANEADPSAEVVAVPVTEGFAAAEYTEKSGEVMGVYEGDTLALETFEYENGDKDVIVNNYYEGSASYNDYASRLNRFYGSSVGFGYYSPYYSSFYSPWYYDPWYYNPWYYGSSFYMSIGFGFGWGWGYPYYPRYYYPRYYYPVCYDPYVCYYGGYYPTYGYSSTGGAYISDGSSTGTSARRRSGNSSRYSSLDYTADKDYISRTTASSRRSTGTSTSRSSSVTTSGNDRGRSVGTQNRTSTELSNRTIPVRETNQQAYRRTSGTTTRANTGTETMKGTRVLPQSSTRNSVSRVNSNAGRTTNAASNQRYVPRYSNPKTTARPSYNNSNSRSFMKVPTTTNKSTFSAPTRRSSPGYSAPSRSSSFGSGIGSSSSSIRSSSGSVSRSSGSVSRSSGSTSGSRSSGSSGRRR